MTPDVRLVLALLRLLPRADREYVVGDIEEGYAGRRSVGGPVAARVWLWRQVAATLAAFLAKAVRGGDAAADLRRAVRSLVRSPGFTAAAVVTIALGIGVVTAMFTVLEQVVLRPLPVRDADRVVVIRNDNAQRNIPHFPFLEPAYDAVREGARTFDVVAATGIGGVGEQIADLGGGEEEMLAVSRVLGDFFGALGAAPVLGRTLRAEDDVPGGPRVAVLSHAAWQRHWGGRPSAIGSTFGLHGESFEIVGVLGPGADYPRGTDAWIAARPVFSRWPGDGPWFELDLIARLGADETAERAAAEIAHLYRTTPELVAAYDGVRPVVRPLRDALIGDVRGTLVLLFAGTVLVLLMACVNLSNLMGVRATGREIGIAVRRALGAGRVRLLRESLAEALCLGAAGAIAGVVVATAAVRLLVPLAPAGVAGLERVGPPDAPALLLAAALAGGIVLLLAAVPVLRSEAVDPARMLRASGRSTVRGGRRGRLIVIAQAGLAVWATATGALLLRTLLNLQSLDPGFRVEGLTIVELEVPYGFGAVPADYPDRLDAIRSRAESHPAVEAVTAMVVPPLIGPGGWLFVPRMPGQSADEAREENPYANFEFVQPGYFATLELPVLRGRALDDGDRAGAPLAIVVNEAAARLYWPGRDALGQTLGARFGEADEWWTVVGIAADARYQDFLERRPVVYFPLRQRNQFPLPYLIVRSSGAGDAALAAVRAAVRAADPAVRVRRASSLRERIEAPLARPRFAFFVLAALAATTLLLAAIGVHGVLAFAVRTRRGELGIRMACGAHPRALRTMVLREGLLLTGIGVLAGAAAAMISGASVRALLHGITPLDPVSLSSGALLVVGVALAASWLPAARAARLDPASVLRAE